MLRQIKCLECDNVILQDSPKFGSMRRKFCNSVCQSKNAYRRRNIKQKPCAWCSKPFRPYKKSKFCKNECRQAYNREYFRKRGVREYHKKNPEAGYWDDRLKCPVCRQLFKRKNVRLYCPNESCRKLYAQSAYDKEQGRNYFHTTRGMLWISIAELQTKAISNDDLFDEEFTPAWMKEKDIDKELLADLQTSIDFNYKHAAEESRKRILEKRNG